MKPYELEKKSVITKDAKELGTVVGVEIDTSTWKVTHLRIGIPDRMLQPLELTLAKKPGEKYVEILVPTETVGTLSDLIVLNKTVKELKKVAGKAS